MEQRSELRKQHDALMAADRAAYSASAFPGTPRWWASVRAHDAVTAFEAAHPEMVAEIKAEQAAKRAAEHAYWDSPEGREKMAGM
jgi:hypothetical protein